MVVTRWIFILILMLTTQTIHGQQRHSDTMDDVLQYVPYASVLALKTCGVKSRSDWPQLAVNMVAAWGTSAAIGWGLKHTVHEWRPDGSDQKSFPSGHSLVAFSGATVLHKEFGSVSPWISIAGYGVATFTAVDRVVRDRHHWYDVASGAAIGFLATEAVYCVSDLLFPKNEHVSMVFTGNSLDVAIRW